MSNESVSPDLATIFSADLAVIRSRVWLIFGHGKREAARRAAGDDPSSLLSDGSVALRIVGDRLHARADAGVIDTDAAATGEDGRGDGRGDGRAEGDPAGGPQWHPVDAMVYGLDPFQTRGAFVSGASYLRRSSAEAIGLLSSRDPYAGTRAAPLVDAQTWARACDPSRRILLMRRVTMELPALPCFVLPFAPSLASKVSQILSAFELRPRLQ